MKSFLANLNEQSSTLPKDAIAKLLKVKPEALARFEEAYKTYTMNEEPNGFFQQNSRQAAEQNHIIDLSTEPVSADTTELQERIVAELLSQTSTYVFDGNLATVHNFKALPADTKPVTLAEVNALPPALQPQLAGNLMKRDIGEDSGPMLLYQYKEYLENPNSSRGRLAYNMFRQGLDILDLDALTTCCAVPV